MAADLHTIIKQLTESSIIAQGKLENFVPPKAHPTTVEELVAELVKNKHLTQFQATQIKAGKAKALILGNYTILDKIGAGGMGQVFKAEHRRLKRVVALKMLPPAVTKDALAVARFQREVEAAAKLRHTNIVATDDADQAGAVHFLVMEYIDGKDLSAMVKKDGPFPVNKAVDYILQAARGLEFAHGEGVVHRDIKPANLLLDKKGGVKILDMGLARIEQADGGVQSELTGTGTIMGTVDYMSPEQALNTRDADQRADIYSLGMSLYYLLAGKAAYSGETAMQKLMAHQNQPIPSLQDVQTTVPKQLDSIFKKMVAKKAEDRYQSMSDVVEALEGLGYGGSTTRGAGDVASTIDLSSADRKKLVSQAKKKPLGSITEVVASEKTKFFFAKIFGGAFGTIIAPILVFYLIRHLEKEDKPAANAPAASVAPAAVAANNTTQSPTLIPSDAGQPNQPWNTLAFQTWMKQTQALPAEQQVEAVSKKLMELNPGFDGNVTGADGKGAPKIEQGVVTEIGFLNTKVTDISPVRAFVRLNVLRCSGGPYSVNNKLSDLSPLQGMRLTSLNCGNSKVSDLSPLRGMLLTEFNCAYTATLSDLSPLKGMPLTILGCNNTHVSDLSALEDCKSLKSVVLRHTPVTSASVATLQKALPNCRIAWDGMDKGLMGSDLGPAKSWESPAFQAWMKATQALPAEQQIEAVRKKLMELNPEYDGKMVGIGAKGNPYGPIFTGDGMVKSLGLNTKDVTDISPVGAFVKLQGLSIVSSKLTDLSPLQGMALTKLICSGTKVSDLSALKAMPLTNLAIDHTEVTDLSPLENCQDLKTLDCRGIKASPASIAALAKSLPNCRIEWDGGKADSGKPKADEPAWNTPAFQQWMKATQALPVEQQIEAVSKKLMELNPGFDGKLTDRTSTKPPRIVGGVVVGVAMRAGAVTDISPVRVWPKLKALSCAAINTNCRFSDLSPLVGMSLTYLYIDGTPVSDLTPIAGMPLVQLYLQNTNVTDISLLSAMPLAELNLRGTPVPAANILSLQKALPNCKIDWDRAETGLGTRGQGLVKKWETPEFRAWMKATQALPAEQQIEAVRKKLMELNPGFDGKVTGGDGKGTPKIQDSVVLEFGFIVDNVTDISPVRSLRGLKGLWCYGNSSGKSRLANLIPLEGMPLESLSLINVPVPGLSSLIGMPLKRLYFQNTLVSDLSSLDGMKLTHLVCNGTPVSDLSPLQGMPLVSLSCEHTQVADLSPLRDCKNLGFLLVMQTKVSPASISALQKALPNCKIEWDDPNKGLGAGDQAIGKTWETPEFQAWVKATQVLPAEKQLEAVREKLIELNPGFDGKLFDPDGRGSPKSERGVVIELGFDVYNVTDISPVRALTGLKILACRCDAAPGRISQGRFSDLSPLRGMKLLSLKVGNSQVSDLSPLRGMPLSFLTCMNTQVSNLSPLEECKNLKSLGINRSKVDPAQVGALQKALPNCRIEWGDPSKAKTPEPASSGTK